MEVLVISSESPDIEPGMFYNGVISGNKNNNYIMIRTSSTKFVSARLVDCVFNWDRTSSSSASQLCRKLLDRMLVEDKLKLMEILKSDIEMSKDAFNEEIRAANQALIKRAKELGIGYTATIQYLK